MVTTLLTQPCEETTAINLEPRSAYEVITRERVEHFADDLREIRSRVNTIFYLVIGSVLLDVLLRFLS